MVSVPPTPGGPGPVPLDGIRIAITRAAEQAGPLADRLRDLGAVVVDVPLIRIAEPADGGAALRACVEAMHTYEWVVFTSPNAARRFLAEAAAAALRADPPFGDGDGAGVDAAGSRPKVAAIGPGTAAVVVEHGWLVDLVPQRSIGEGLAEVFPVFERKSNRVLFPRAAVARPVVADALTAKGWDVTVVDAYQTLPVDISEDHVAMLREAQIIVLTSSSTATVTANALGTDGADTDTDTDARAMDSAKTDRVGRQIPPIVSMGIATTATAMDRGLPVTLTADPSTLDGLINACISVAQSVYPRHL